ncbi:MAG: guanylate kinase, partial [Candidatus Gracilibacteria bacterium]|nr:guanylate kinase [Candidatus Gracilibacteria bacterium]
FLEWACVHKKNYYGLLKKTVFDALEDGSVVFREIDIQGFESICEIIPSDHLVSIFLMPPSLDILKKRIMERSPLSDEEIDRRIESAKIEISLSKECDYVIQTEDNEIEKLLNEIEEIILKEAMA